jgi:hypothetical protein
MTVRIRWTSWLIIGMSISILAYVAGHMGARVGLAVNDVLDDAVRQLIDRVEAPEYMEPQVYDRHGAFEYLPDAIQPGLTLIASVWKRDGRPMPGLRLIDRTGAVLHAWWVEPSLIVPDSLKSQVSVEDLHIHGAYLFDDGDVLVNVEYLGTVRLDACSAPLWVLTEGNHHSIAPAEDGSFWIPAVTPRLGPESGAYPHEFPWLNRPAYLDRLLRVSPDGKVLTDKLLLDVVIANGLERYVFKAGHKEDWEVTHLNDIDPLPSRLAPEFPMFEAGDLLVSLRNLDLVMVVDPDDWQVKWHSSDPFLGQHDPDFMPGGRIGVFDNSDDGSDRGNVLGGSRIVAIDPRTDSVAVLFPTPSSDAFYTAIRGRWQLLSNGNLLLLEASPGRVVEVAPDGRTVWQWIVETWDDSRTPAVTDAERLDLEPEDVRGWPCSVPGPLSDRGGR